MMLPLADIGTGEAAAVSGAVVVILGAVFAFLLKWRSQPAADERTDTGRFAPISAVDEVARTGLEAVRDDVERHEKAISDVARSVEFLGGKLFKRLDEQTTAINNLTVQVVGAYVSKKDCEDRRDECPGRRGP
jgi:hypothetical protein